MAISYSSKRKPKNVEVALDLSDGQRLEEF